jgi:DNA-binding MarR family transcriptional regulator
MSTANSNVKDIEVRKSLAFDLLNAAGYLERRLDRALSGIRGISFSEYRMLRVLAARPGARAMRVELAEAVGLTPSAVTRALKPMEKLGLIETLKSDRDARRSLACLTSSGQELLSDAEGVVRDVMVGMPIEALGEAGLDDFLRQVGERV